MTGKMPHRLPSICGALIVFCLVGVFSPPHAAVDNLAEGNQHNSISYAKQTIQDSSPLPNTGGRYRFITFARNARLDYGLAQPLFLSTFPSPYVINPLLVELPVPQSLAVFNPTTRSPPV